MTVFQLLHWNGSLKAMRERQCSRQVGLFKGSAGFVQRTEAEVPPAWLNIFAMSFLKLLELGTTWRAASSPLF